MHYSNNSNWFFKKSPQWKFQPSLCFWLKFDGNFSAFHVPPWWCWWNELSGWSVSLLVSHVEYSAVCQTLQYTRDTQLSQSVFIIWHGSPVCPCQIRPRGRAALRLRKKTSMWARTHADNGTIIYVCIPCIFINQINRQQWSCQSGFVSRVTESNETDICQTWVMMTPLTMTKQHYQIFQLQYLTTKKPRKHCIFNTKLNK